jgi:NhaA family Na+:H+ antiporter
MVAPAGLYLALNWGSPGARGWGVPMATDIAFALGVLALLGRGVPIALRVFLTALAIVDDLGAVLVIAVFYTAELSLQHLGLGALVLGVLTAANLAGVRRLSIYCLGGAILWLAFLQSGVHATVAGVLLAMTIPSQTTKSISLADRMSALLARQLARMRGGRRPHLSAHESRGHVPPVEHHASSPMHALEHRLHPWVTYGVLPVFALGNAGVSLGGGHLLASLAHPVSLGVMAGLVLGKQLGITLATWVAVRTGLAALPAGMAWRHVYGIGWLGGIGFTMSIFIAGLAFGDGELLNTTKLAIFAGSLCSGAVGWAILRGAVRSPVRSAESEDR